METLSANTLTMALQAVNAEIRRLRESAHGDIAELEPDDQELLLAFSQAAMELTAAAGSSANDDPNLCVAAERIKRYIRRRPELANHVTAVEDPSMPEPPGRLSWPMEDAFAYRDLRAGIRPIVSEYRILWDALKHYEQRLATLSSMTLDEGQKLGFDHCLQDLAGLLRSLEIAAQKDYQLEL